MLYVFLFRSVCKFLYGPFCHGALKPEISTLFTTFFIWISLQFKLYWWTQERCLMDWLLQYYIISVVVKLLYQTNLASKLILFSFLCRPIWKCGLGHHLHVRRIITQRNSCWNISTRLNFYCFQGNAIGQCGLGIMNLYGRGVDYQKSLNLWWLI